ncbi:MAG: hypothetical protein JWM10_720 [Myxococcaceae bacterium]|nr:hypothetical protein [Myxococcaceae bacterium]
MRVCRVDEWLRRLSQPELHVGIAPKLGVGDVLLMCAGFEDRAIEVLRRAVRSGCHGFRVLCIGYLPEIPENRGTEVASLCASAQATLESVPFDRERPAGTAERILAQVPSADRIHIDLSGMSRLLIVQLVSSIVRGGRSALCEVLYCSAFDYPPTREQVEKTLSESADLVGVTMFVSSGVFGLTIVPELSSVAMQGQPMRVIAFPSWNTTQLAAVCSEIQASYFTIVHGTPPDAQNAWRRDVIRELNRVDSLPAREEFNVSTLDYRETLNLILDVYAEHGQREKLVISPTGSKMQSLAIGIACGFLRDLQVVYPTPRSFAPPKDYTRGVGDVYRLPLGRFTLPAELTC